MTETVEKLADCDKLERQHEPSANSVPAPSIEVVSSADGPASSAAPASHPDCDVLMGGRAIANWLGLTYEQVRPLIDDKTIPTFKLPGHTKRCALKSTLNETFRQYANRRRPIASAPAEEKTRVTA